MLINPKTTDLPEHIRVRVCACVCVCSLGSFLMELITCLTGSIPLHSPPCPDVTTAMNIYAYKQTHTDTHICGLQEAFSRR